MLQKNNPLIEFAVMHNEDALTGNNDETRAAPQTPQVKRFGLIGDPIAHSLSPALFRAGYGTGEYTYDLIEGADFETSYRRFLDSYQGINVTAPFKELAFAKADIRSPECRKIGATNLLVKTPEGIKAYNSDYSGVILSLLTAMNPEMDAEQFLPFLNGIASQSSEEPYGVQSAHNENSEESSGSGTTHSVISGENTVTEAKVQKPGKDRKALVVGCGGAGKAAAVAAGDLGFFTTLINRTPDRAEAIAAVLPEYGFMVRPIEDFTAAYEEADIIIYTLPGPLPELHTIFGKGHPRTFQTTSAKKQPLSGTWHQGKIVLEANYRNPSFTPELLRTAGTEIRYIHGTAWLLYQAYAGYGIFTGHTPDMNAMMSVLRH